MEIVIHNMEKKTFKILSIDGGGIKGLYSSTILEHFEEKFNCKISDHFDMICGTSTGGLIALALSLKIPAKDISKLYTEKGSIIFPKMFKLKGIMKQVCLNGKYSDKGLISALKEIFGERTLSESNNLLCIPSYNFTESKPTVFKYDHPGKDGKVLDRDNNKKYIDIALATTAAPTYFPICEMKDNNLNQYIDGGVWANNPTLVGLIEAIKYFVGNNKEYNNIQILSLSSLNKDGGNPIGHKRKMSFVNWRNELFDIFNYGQSYFTNYFMESIKEFDDIKIDYLRIPSVRISSKQEFLIQMDNASKNSLNQIKSMGDSQAEIYKKDDKIIKLFNQKKTYIINK